MKVAFDTDWYDILCDYPREVRLSVYESIFLYAETGEISDLDPQAELAFRFIKKEIDRDLEIRNVRSQARGKKQNESNDIKSNQNESNQIKSNQTESNDIKTNQNESKRIKSNQIKSNDIKTEQTESKVFKEEKEEKEELPPLHPPIEEKQEKEENLKKTTKQVCCKKKFGEAVLMTEEEFDKLIASYGKEATMWCINKLDNYKLSKGTKYKSDYRAILSWVVDEYQKSKNHDNNPNKTERDISFGYWAAEKLNGSRVQGEVWQQGTNP